jgi:hypothetical protein
VTAAAARTARRGALLCAALWAAGGGVARAAPEAPPEAEPRWRFRGEGQFPVLAADHAVGGFGLAAAFEKGLVSAGVEAQIFPIVVCDMSCGNAYGAGLTFALQPHVTPKMVARLGVAIDYFVHPSFSQQLGTIGPRVGLRYSERGPAISLEAGLHFTGSSQLDVGGFAHNKVFSWAMPELILGLWL